MTAAAAGQSHTRPAEGTTAEVGVRIRTHASLCSGPPEPYWFELHRRDQREART